MATSASASNLVLACGTMLAAIFVAIQAWVARTSFVEGEAARIIERKLDICFENFDDAAQLDAALRLAVPGMAAPDEWPPKVKVETPAVLAIVKREIVPKLDDLEAGLTKASVLGNLDKFRAYLAQQIRGLSKQILDVNPAHLGPENEQTKAVFAKLSDFLGAQYSVFTGCRLLAEGRE